MKVQLNKYDTTKDQVSVIGPACDISISEQADYLARYTDTMVLADPKDQFIWFYTVEEWSGDIWAAQEEPIVNREFSTCATCGRDIYKIGDPGSWRHLDNDVALDHPVFPRKAKKPTVVPNNELEKLFMKYFHHLKAMGVDTYLEFHHHYNTTVDFTPEEWAKLQEMDVDAFIQE